MPSHTPGPWIYCVTPAAATICDTGGDFVAWFHQLPKLADAELIAAAPDLLVALLPLATWAEHERRKHNAHGEENEAAYMGILSDNAKAAIAKARGKA